jgi:ketosteroid isomerase-like protein
LATVEDSYHGKSSNIPNDDDDDESPRPSHSHHARNDSSSQLDNGSENDTMGLNKRIRLAKAQAEIDRILNNPIDPPFDVESEMKKVVSITPPLVTEGTSEYEAEEQVSQMEEELYSAVKAQDFATAADRQAEISNRHIDDCGQVIQLNGRFYKAFSNKDVDEMERIWLKDRSCICIHPSFKVLMGVRDIMHTWKRMFESSVGSFQRTWIDPCDIRLTVKATTAIVTCEEQVYARRFVRGKKRESELVNKLMATNIFRKVGGKWYMTYHHSSWHADSEAAKNALKHGNKGMAKTVSANNGNRRRYRRQDEDETGPTGLENILGLGNSGPLLGNGGGNGMRNMRSDSLPDLSDAFDTLRRLRQQNPNVNIHRDIGSPGAIIHFSTFDSDDEEDDDEEDEDDDETYEIIDDEDDDGQDESFSSLQSWVKRTRAQRRNRMKQQSKPTDPLRQECIDSLRKLANEGRISPKQKRILLTDIISCSSEGKSSMVEVAYGLLCGEGKDPEESEEEFVDQCQVFAQSLSEPKY